MNLAFIMVKTASEVYTLTYRRNNVTSSRRRKYMNNMTSWYQHLDVNIFLNFWISWEMKTSPRTWKTRLFEYVKFRKSIFYDLRALFSRRQSFVLFFNQIPDYWMGGSDRGEEGTWRWETSGSRLNYTYWGPGEPNSYRGADEDCLAMSSYGRRWNDYPCDLGAYYICESVWVCKHNVVHINYAFVN